MKWASLTLIVCVAALLAMIGQWGALAALVFLCIFIATFVSLERRGP